MGSQARCPNIDEISFQAFAYPGRDFRAKNINLTATQQKIFNLREMHWSTKSIADKLNLTVQGIRTHIAAIRQKGAVI